MNDELNTRLATIKIIHLAMAAGISFFILFLFIQAGRVEPRQVDASEKTLPRLIGMVSLGLIFVSAAAGNLLARKNFARAKETTDVTAKLQLFNAAHIMRLALIEGPALLALVGLVIHIFGGGSLFDFSVTGFHFATIVVFYALWTIMFPGKESVYKAAGLNP